MGEIKDFFKRVIFSCKAMKKFILLKIGKKDMFVFFDYDSKDIYILSKNLNQNYGMVNFYQIEGFTNMYTVVYFKEGVNEEEFYKKFREELLENKEIVSYFNERKTLNKVLLESIEKMIEHNQYRRDHKND